MSDGDCGCVLKSEWDDDTTACLDELDDYVCSRPEGHDGPHTACNQIEHPVMVWEGEQ